jgi:S1-C subfamily serine protease
LITTNVIQRTFQLRFGGGTGTCFTIDLGGQQYIVTAKHCVDGLKDGEEIEVFHESNWKPIQVALVGHGSSDVDVSVLAASQQLSPLHPLPPTAAGMELGQDVYFLGFPFGLSSDSNILNGGFPFPLVKKAVLSASNFESNDVMLLDGLNNPGFSGGPVVFTKPGGARNDFSVAAVISAYRVSSIPVNHGGIPTPLTVNENTGIIIAYSINHALELIKTNPIGFCLP